MKCPHHGGVTFDPECPLHKLADHTITVTEARRPRTGVIIVLVDLDDPEHSALGASNLPPDFVADQLMHHAARLRGLHVDPAELGYETDDDYKGFPP